MKIWRKALGSCMIALIVSAIGLGANSADPPMSESCRKFVQAFYDWYNLPNGEPGKERSAEDATKLKSSDFDAELLRRLNEDFAAQAKAKGELVGLDMDPFLATNSTPYKKYLVGKVIPKSGTFTAEVFGIEAGKKTPQPIVITELRCKDKHWQFVNFHYEPSKIRENENLLSILKVLREERVKYGTK